jgi:hypothetical protein
MTARGGMCTPVHVKPKPPPHSFASVPLVAIIKRLCAHPLNPFPPGIDSFCSLATALHSR